MVRLAAAALVAGACGRATDVEVVAALDSGVLPGLEIAVLPYDPGCLLDSLGAAAPRPRPDLRDLEAELRAFRRPAYQEDDARVRAWAVVRDSVRRLSDSLRAVDRRSPGYAAAYDRFRRLYERFLQHTAVRDAGVRELTAEVRDLALRAGRGADSLRAWEAEAYAGLDSVAAGHVATSGRAPIRAVTEADGRAHLSLAPGPWWLDARAPHPENPFLEYRWRLGVTAGGFPVRLPLSAGTARLEWRH